MMRRIFYNSSIARWLLCLNNCTTITIGPFVFSVFRKGMMPQYVRNHECTHSRQWCEITMLAGFVMWMIVGLFRLPVWCIGIAPVVFYLWYVVEWLVRLLLIRDAKKAYKQISFEQEASKNEENPHYNENSRYFAWLKYLN